MVKAEVSHREGLKRNLKHWCFEVGTRFERVNRSAAAEFVAIIAALRRERSIVDLGCGDGAAANVFIEQRFEYVGVDVNPAKLERLNGTGVRMDMLDWLGDQPSDSIANVFTHHALEHVVKVDEVLREIGRVIRPGGLYYAVVPADDLVHEVHFVAFDRAGELLPPRIGPLICARQVRGDPEFICVGVKENV